ncbi:MAG: hypothetical protein KDJ65_04740 [Anaerolineae bacterium]|nr:hypothetical protein [Anaerolineae bacterium]
MMEDESAETSMDTEGLDDFIQQAEAAADRDDLNVTFEQIEGEDGSLNYLMQADGQNLETLNETFFEGEADISVNEVNGRREITIRADMSDENDGEEPPTAEELEMMKSFGIGFTFRISGGEIISSNATRVEGSTAIWEFPSIIEVTLTEAPTFAPETLALQEAPSGEFSLSALEALAEDMETMEFDQSTEASRSQSLDTLEVETETSTEIMEPTQETPVDDQATTADAPTDQTDTPMTMTEENDSSPVIAQSLPASGATLAQQTPLAVLVLSALTLMTLSFGATTALLKKE